MLFFVSLLCAGVSLCLFIYVLLHPGVKDTPDDQQIYFTKLRWIWPWIAVISTGVRPFLSWKYQKELEVKIQLAGYAGYVSVNDIAGLQGFSAVVLGVLSCWWVNFLSVSLWMMMGVTIGMIWIGSYLPIAFLKNKIQQRQKSVLKAFPFFLDMITLCVESGSNLQTALMVASNVLSEGALRQEVLHALNDMRTGVTRLDSLKAMATRCGLAEVKQWVASLAQAENLGTSLGPALRAQAEQFRNERFLRAEKLAAEAPVKLLFPLVVFIFPCTFLVIAYPLVMRFAQASLW